MTRKHGYLKESVSQTAGPYVHIGCTPNFAGIDGLYEHDLGADMVNDDTRGERITFCGTIYDGTGAALRDALVEIWQADANGLYPSAAESRGTADPNFGGWGRCPSNPESGEFVFHTIKPGRVPFRDGRLMAPHIVIWVVARGINIALQTRAYFLDEETANAEDPILSRIEHQNRVPTLLARPEAQGVYRFDIRLQGEGETIFFDM